MLSSLLMSTHPFCTAAAPAQSSIFSGNRKSPLLLISGLEHRHHDGLLARSWCLGSCFTNNPFYSTLIQKEFLVDLWPEAEHQHSGVRDGTTGREHSVSPGSAPNPHSGALLWLTYLNGSGSRLWLSDGFFCSQSNPSWKQRQAPNLAFCSMLIPLLGTASAFGTLPSPFCSIW